MQQTELTEFLNTLKEVKNRFEKKEKIQERVKNLQAQVTFAKKMELPDYKMVDIYKSLVTHLTQENSLLLEMQTEDMFEDIQQLLELNQAYIKKAKEQFDEIEALNAKLAKQKHVQNNKKTQELQVELKETKQKLQQRNNKVKELHEKVDSLQNKQRELHEKVDSLQKKQKVSRELSKKDQRLLKLYNTPKKYFSDSKKWYVRPISIFFRA